MYPSLFRQKSLSIVYYLLFMFIIILFIQCEKKELGGDPLNKIYRAKFEKGKIVKFSKSSLPEEAFSKIDKDYKKVKDIDSLKRVDYKEKIHPLLKKWISERKGDEIEQVIISFYDDIEMPRFPSYFNNEPFHSTKNRAVKYKVREIIAEIIKTRAPKYDYWETELKKQYETDVLWRSWLASSVLATIPLSKVFNLAQRNEVLFISPNNTNDKPPDYETENDIDDGRERINSDGFYTYTSDAPGWSIGLFDTGIRASHTLFDRAPGVRYCLDCVDGNDFCCGGDPDDKYRTGHGTSSAAIITANDNMGDEYQGVTNYILDSYRVYGHDEYLKEAAVLKAFEQAMLNQNKVIVAEMQASGYNELSAICQHADNAFDCGYVVIAANGNKRPDKEEVNEPALAHKVIGVGAYDVITGNLNTSQCEGPAPDGRIKPDIIAPTNTESASNQRDTGLKIFTGTSGSTPYIGGAAAKILSLLNSKAECTDPGQVYSLLILMGDKSHSFDNISGAGKFRFHTHGRKLWGKVELEDSEEVLIPISEAGDFCDAAIWWPEDALSPHNDINLYVLESTSMSSMIGMSEQAASVFEKVHVGGSGIGCLNIVGADIQTASQIVYWAVSARTHMEFFADH